MDSVATAFELMEIELSTAVENLNGEGARLFRNSEYDAAKRLTEKGAALQDFCARVSALSKEWNEKYAEQPDSRVSVVNEEETARRILSASKGAKTGLLVRFPDGTVICEAKAADTLALAIKKIGFEKVEALNIRVNHENLVSRQKSRNYNDVFLSPFYIKTHSSTDAKKKNLERISDRLGLRLIVSIVS
jgi:hypothetical protein